jgi:anti-anti-sigma factor
MEIQRRQHGAVTVLRPEGALAGADAERLKEEASNASARSLGRVAIDLSGVTFTDSRGLEVLVELADEASQSGRTLRLCSVPETLREVFGLTGIGDGFDLFQDAASAARSFL